MLTQSKRRCLFMLLAHFLLHTLSFFPQWTHPIILLLGVLISHIFVRLERPSIALHSLVNHQKKFR